MKNNKKNEIDAFAMSWGTLSPEELPSERRQQDLGLASAVRYFNDRAVPGLGGLWFPMPLVWSILAVALTENLRKPSALPIGNAIEALVMKHSISIDHGGRLRGTQKLQSVEDKSFKNLSRTGVYVVQPLRMAMVQPLVELGFVTGSRYGAFRLADAGRQMLELKDVKPWYKALENWVNGKEPNKELDVVLNALSPLSKTPNSVRQLIKARILKGNGSTDKDAQRRHALWKLQKGPSEEQLSAQRPEVITESHWTDLCAGAAFIDLRDSALDVLSTLEECFKTKKQNNANDMWLSLDDAVTVSSEKLDSLKECAKKSLKLIQPAGEGDSIQFANECLEEPKVCLKNLAKRDGSVIVWLEDKNIFIPGPAFDSSDRNAQESDQPANKSDFAPQLFRLWNLHCLMCELDGKANPRSPKLRMND